MKRRLGKSSSLYEIILYEFDGLKTHYMSASYFMEHFYSMRYWISHARIDSEWQWRTSPILSNDLCFINNAWLEGVIMINSNLKGIVSVTDALVSAQHSVHLLNQRQRRPNRPRLLPKVSWKPSQQIRRQEACRWEIRWLPADWLDCFCLNPDSWIRVLFRSCWNDEDSGSANRTRRSREQREIAASRWRFTTATTLIRPTSSKRSATPFRSRWSARISSRRAVHSSSAFTGSLFAHFKLNWVQYPHRSNNIHLVRSESFRLISLFLSSLRLKSSVFIARLSIYLERSVATPSSKWKPSSRRCHSILRRFFDDPISISKLDPSSSEA